MNPALIEALSHEMARERRSAQPRGEASRPSRRAVRAPLLVIRSMPFWAQPATAGRRRAYFPEPSQTA